MAKRYTPYFEYNFDKFDFDNFLEGGGILHTASRA